ncbi:SDR family oxidoreductase [Aquimarina sp. ERC-38]|uniref:SDR family oxidoreductase n=1 Tax=Aquimarina sp. ERC-38 TaxID=2949996 RepID=UPI00224651FA|nr:SDR family oxidoreductase [Aquimarina sp. ERC-38]UZO80874.1 SDR family oxidoreductase [Aquimarina sp. ERC-38]
MQKPNQRLKNQNAIITGSSNGIGKAIAIAIAREGANVLINYHSDKEGAEEVAHTISKFDNPGKTIVCKGDVSKEDDVLAMFSQVHKNFGPVDICVPNAGIQMDAPLHEMTLEQWSTVVNVNLTGQFLCARSAIREFLKNGVREGISRSAGKIIHVSSVHEVIPWAGHANYAASKGGLVMLMQSICQEYGPYKIRCNSVAPGAIKTDINKEVWGDPVKLEKVKELIPYKEMGEAEEIGSVACWLASDESEYINGTTIFVDGGMTCYPGFTTNG